MPVVARARPKTSMTGIGPPAGLIMTIADAGRGNKIRPKKA
jgi:hypothetical protein